MPYSPLVFYSDLFYYPKYGKKFKSKKGAGASSGPASRFYGLDFPGAGKPPPGVNLIIGYLKRKSRVD
ncbi:hypothetical protein COT77_02065 [Candidatus Berkelbacteria bacterium CG10_big_fil_rev_8_21_14_0_10_41_12]|uniref:Uncharacterized protein n=1 Tax=Candidatus Berkelbacteria bacterium CG10_big_fil_rev_8_21_14_0_10_41_12 TaxID=1974513 RepID=A0A2M6WX21_9BACT|nr:MAG: hypothetical protein COT77_02065 [Candidatus Berkelbacteria bacterium CG10_big_fil_rev_8_21_14_0_10_41_12]